jgi:hypothetical protein
VVLNVLKSNAILPAVFAVCEVSVVALIINDFALAVVE